MNATPADDFDPSLLDSEVTHFSTDSRAVKPGEVFFAFSQPEFANNCFNGEFMDAGVFVKSASKMEPRRLSSEKKRSRT